MSDKELLHYQGVNCPECHKNIMILLGTPEAVTLEEFKRRSQEQVKAMREARKAERKAKP